MQNERPVVRQRTIIQDLILLPVVRQRTIVQDLILLIGFLEKGLGMSRQYAK